MTIETKFDIDEKVWIVYDKSISATYTVEGVVRRIKINITCDGYRKEIYEAVEYDIYYTFSGTGYVDKFQETKVFKTKQELIDSL